MNAQTMVVMTTSIFMRGLVNSYKSARCDGDRSIGKTNSAEVEELIPAALFQIARLERQLLAAERVDGKEYKCLARTASIKVVTNVNAPTATWALAISAGLRSNTNQCHSPA